MRIAYCVSREDLRNTQYVIRQIPRILNAKSAFTDRGRFICLLLFGLLLPWQTVLAHGGGDLQVANAPIATYQVSVWTNPPTARDNQPIHVTVGVKTAVSGEPVLNATVNVIMLNEDGDILATTAAKTELSINRLFYEADLVGVPVGTYEIVVEVSGDDGSGELSFPLDVASHAWWPWLAGVVAGGFVLWLTLRYWRRTYNVGVSRRGTAVERPRSVD